MALDRAARLFTSGAAVEVQGLIADDGLALARSTIAFSINLSILTQSILVGTVDEVVGVEQDLHPLLWGGIRLAWDGKQLVWG